MNGEKRMSQPTFAALAFANKKKKTRREKFLAEMEQVVPWAKLRRVIEKHYPRAGNGRPPMGLEKMLRIYFLQQVVQSLGSSDGRCAL
jgi:IS5 family transposase